MCVKNVFGEGSIIPSVLVINGTTLTELGFYISILTERFDFSEIIFFPHQFRDSATSFIPFRDSETII